MKGEKNKKSWKHKKKTIFIGIIITILIVFVLFKANTSGEPEKILNGINETQMNVTNFELGYETLKSEIFMQLVRNNYAILILEHNDTHDVAIQLMPNSLQYLRK